MVAHAYAPASTKKTTLAGLRTFSIYAAVQMLAYTILVYNLRVIADKRMAAALVSDALYATLNFVLLQKIFKENHGVPAWAGYTIGSVIGTALGMWVGR